MAAVITPRNRALSSWNFSLVIVFLYFLTLSLDLLNVDIGVLKLKISHVAALVTFVLFAIAQRGIFLERRLFFCFTAILVSSLISSACSLWISRSFFYSIICVFTFFSYFFISFNIIRSFDENKVIRIYIITYLIVGSYAGLQFFSSLVGITLPFSVQKMVFTRGSALALEPSFYALYAIPFVVFLNSKWLLSKHPTNFVGLLFANLFLLVSTSTSAFFSYIVFFVVVLFIPYQLQLRKKLLKVSLIFVTFFTLIGCLLFELFKKTFLKFFYYGLLHESFLDRFNGIVTAFGVFLEHPFFGVGLGGVGPYLFQKEFFPGHSGQITDVDRLMIEKFEPTNVTTEILASLGLLGFAAFSLLIIALLRPFLKLFNDQRLLPLERINLMSFFISIIVMLVCLQINQGLFRGYIWVHLGLGVGYALKIHRRLN